MESSPDATTRARRYWANRALPIWRYEHEVRRRQSDPGSRRSFGETLDILDPTELIIEAQRGLQLSERVSASRDHVLPINGRKEAGHATPVRSAKHADGPAGVKPDRPTATSN
jgi:hypothetical protein